MLPRPFDDVNAGFLTNTRVTGIGIIRSGTNNATTNLTDS
jgi:hypothetical protein